MAVLGVAALAALKGYLWVQAGETWKAALLGTGIALGLAVVGWAWHRWKKARSRVYGPLLIREKVSRIAFDGELQVTAVLPPDAGPKRAKEMLASVAAAYRHYDHPAGARFRVGKVRPALPDPSMMHPAGAGLFGKRSVLGVREAAALWHPPGARDETPLVERSGARVLLPSAKGVRSGAHVGETTAGKPRPVHFSGDLVRRHHLYVARTRMGKSTLMHHIVVHKMMEKAEGRDTDTIVVVDPHADLVGGLLQHVPESLIDRVRLIDLADERGAPGINLLDTRVFADRDRTADSVVRVARGLWEQWGPRMQSILEQTVKTLHEANERMNADKQYTILDGLKLLSDEKFQSGVLEKVSDPYLLEWWARDFGKWHPQYKAEALAPVQTRLSYYASSKKARAILGQSRSTIDMRETILDGGVLLVSTSQGVVGRDVAALVGASLLNLVDAVIQEQGSVPLEKRRGALVVVDEIAVHARRGLRVDAQRAGQVRGQLHPGHPEPRQAGRPLPHHAGHHPGKHRMPRRLPGVRVRRQDAGLGAGQGPGVRGRHHVASGVPLLRAGHRGNRPDGRLLDGSQQAGARRPGEGRPHPRRGVVIRHGGEGPLRRGGGLGEEGGGLPEGPRRPQGRRRPLTAGDEERRFRGLGAAQAAQQASPGRRRGRGGCAGRGAGRMRPAGCEGDLLRRLASMPFLDRLEMVYVSGWSRGAVYESVRKLEDEGLVSAVSHAADLIPPTLRYQLTAAGLRRLARDEGMTVDELLRRRPVSARWRRVLMERLDTVAVIYRLASAISNIAHPIRFRWYRAMPMDAAMLLPGGRTVGVVRQGAASDRTGFSKRLWRLREGPLLGAVLMLMPDEARLRHARRLLTGSPVPALLALERDAALAGGGGRVWHLPSIAATVDLRRVLSHTDRGSALPKEPEPSRAKLPEDIAPDGPGRDVPDHALPALLKPAEKRALDLISDWTWITLKHLASLLNVSGSRASRLAVHLEGRGLTVHAAAAGRRRLALSDRGLALLARRDRASVGVAKRRWSVTPLDPEAPLDWRNVTGRRSRQLLRNLEHTAAVHAFTAALARQSRSLGWKIVQIDPPMRASRHFRHGDLPVRAGGMRAVRPTTMADRLAPYLRYYSSHRPTDDHGAQPAVLVVFDDDLAATHFLRVAREEMDRAGVTVPLWVSHRAVLNDLGPLGRAWRTTGGPETGHAFSTG